MIGHLLLAAAACSAIGLLSAYRAPRVWIVATLAATVLALAASVSVFVAGEAWDWRLATVGEGLHLRLDGISAFFLALLALIGGLSGLYSHQYWADSAHPVSARSGRAWWNAVLVSMAAVLLSANGLHFLIAWELFSLCVYFLITLERDKREVRSAGWLFLVASHAGTLCLIVFFASLWIHTGSWELGPMREHAVLTRYFWLALIGFGVKAGLYPLHIWLPSAHANAPSHVSAFLSGVSIKMGVYGLVRFSGWLPPSDSAGWILAAIGTISAVLGVAFALGQHDLKRLLAYHSVENVGIIVIGLGFAMVAAAHGDAAWGRLAMAGSLLHVWNHGLFKALLFLGAGSVLHATGTREMSRLGGLWRAMPWTTGAFVLGAAAIAGIPPLNGFVSEFLVYMGLLGSLVSPGSMAWAAAPVAILLCVTGALALACFVKACGIVFLGTPRTQAARSAHESGWVMRAPMLILCVACVAIGLAPAFLWGALAHSVWAWNSHWNPDAVPVSLLALSAFHTSLAVVALVAVLALRHLVRRNGVVRAATWGCGYARPAARMQYTAGSFADIITGWFSWILRPSGAAERPSGWFPAHASLEEHTPETVLVEVVNPGSSLLLRAAGAARRLQHGRVQAYVLYILIGVLGLALLAVVGGR